AAQTPPLAGHRVGGHEGHVRLVVVADVLEGGEEAVAVAEDGVVAQGAGADGGQHLRPTRRGRTGVLGSVLGTQPDHLADPPPRPRTLPAHGSTRSPSRWTRSPVPRLLECSPATSMRSRCGPGGSASSCTQTPQMWSPA